MTKPRISLETFGQIEIKVGTVQSAERVPDTDKLLRLVVDFGPTVSAEPARESSGEEMPAAEPEPRDVRQIISGIAAYTAPEALVGQQLTFVTNLEPRTIRGLESNGMLFAVGAGDSFSFVAPTRQVPNGTAAH